MIVLDTNVVSEVMRTDRNAAVQAWFKRQRLSAVHLASPTLAELLVGIAILPNGRRKSGLSADLKTVMDGRLSARVLPFDKRAAEAYAAIIARARGQGEFIATIDGQIAAIAATHGFAVATRDTRPFIAAGLPVIDPWQHQAD